MTVSIAAASSYYEGIATTSKHLIYNHEENEQKIIARMEQAFQFIQSAQEYFSNREAHTSPEGGFQTKNIQDIINGIIENIRPDFEEYLEESEGTDS